MAPIFQELTQLLKEFHATTQRQKALLRLTDQDAAAIEAAPRDQVPDWFLKYYAAVVVSGARVGMPDYFGYRVEWGARERQIVEDL